MAGWWAIVIARKKCNLALLLFVLFLLLPSTDTIEKYFGTQGVGIYLLGVGIALLIGCRRILPVLVAKMTDHRASVLAALTFVCLSAIFAFLYPIADSGILGGGSDADDALDIAARELLHGRYPYYLKTYLGNDIAPLPGAIILAIPFVVLGTSAYQNLFWLGIFFFIAKRYLNSGSSALVLSWVILWFSPTVLQNVMTGEDRLANTIYIMAGIWLMISIIPSADAAAWKKILPSVFLGVGLASRANFVLLVPLLFSVLVRNNGWRVATRYVAITLGTTAIITIPFWIYDPHGFSPLFNQSEKIAQFQSVVPWAEIIIPVASVCAAVILSARQMEADCVRLFRNCAIVQICPVLLVLLFSSIKTKSLNLELAGYGMFALFFGVLAQWKAAFCRQVT